MSTDFQETKLHILSTHPYIIHSDVSNAFVLAEGQCSAHSV